MTTTLRLTDYRSWRAEAAGRDRAFADGYRAWRAEAASRDRQLADGYRAGVTDGRHHRDRLRGARHCGSGTRPNHRGGISLDHSSMLPAVQPAPA
jgi:hypothetical protein